MAATINSQVIQQIHEKERDITGKDSLVAGGPTAAAQKHVGETLDGHVISEITAGEKHVNNGERVKGGPTSTAQSILTKSFIKNGIKANDTTSKSHGSDVHEQSENLSKSVQSKLDSDESAKLFMQAIDKATTQFKTEMTRQLEEFEETIHQKVVQMSPNKFEGHPKLDSNTVSVILAAEKKITGNKMPIKGGPTAQAQRHAGEDIASDNILAVSRGEKRISSTGKLTEDGPTAILEQKLKDCHMEEAH